MSTEAATPATDHLIERLTADLSPVRPLPPPLLRSLGSIAIATALIAALTYMRGMRGDFQVAVATPAYLIQLAGAWLTGALATIAAFAISVPDRPQFYLSLPLPAVLLWLTGFAYGCLGHWIDIPADAAVMAESTRCLETITIMSVPLGGFLWLVLRRARPLRPNGTAWMGALAVAGFADTAHLLIHQVQASALVLVINLVPVAVILGLGALVGPRTLASP